MGIDGEVRAAVLQACVDRKRGSTAFPSGAIDACFDVCGRRAREVREVLIVGELSPPPLRALKGLAPIRDRLARLAPDAVARARLEPLGLGGARIRAMPRQERWWFPGIASPALAWGAECAGIRPGEAPGLWGPAYKDVAIFRALGACSLPRETEPPPLDGLRVGVFDGALPFGPHAGRRSVGDAPLWDPLPLTPLDAIDAWRKGACDALRIGPYWLGPADR